MTQSYDQTLNFKGCYQNTHIHTHKPLYGTDNQWQYIIHGYKRQASELLYSLRHTIKDPVSSKKIESLKCNAEPWQLLSSYMNSAENNVLKINIKIASDQFPCNINSEII